RRVLAGDNPELRATWSRYQLARAAMHKELIEPRLDIAAAVSAALADEAAPAQPQRSGWKGLGRLAVAASVTVAVLAGVRLSNRSDVAGPQLLSRLPSRVSRCRRPTRGRPCWPVIAKGRRRCRRKLQPITRRSSVGMRNACRPT